MKKIKIMTQTPPLKQKKLEDEIDKMVFDLYGLTEEERAVVLGS